MAMSDALSGRALWSSFWPLPRLGWGLFLLGVAAAILVVAGAGAGTASLVAGIAIFLLAWRFPYVAMYVSIGLGLLLGLTTSISTSDLSFGIRAFGGAIDVTLGEIVAAAVLAGWGTRILLYWRRRNDKNWEPFLPIAKEYSLVVIAHLLSAFSAARPDALLVAKYAFRPVAFAYLASVAIPVNFIRNRRRLSAALGIVAALGFVFALDGARSLFVFESGTFALHRARPLLWFGYNLLGGNHNALGELMLLAAPMTLAWATLQSSKNRRDVARAAAGLMVVITLLTFARSAWIALTIEVSFLALTIWRADLKRHLRLVVLVGVLIAPLAAYMVWFSLTPGVQSSTDARATLTGIALSLFEGNPLVGVGAGRFVERVSRTWAYTVEFGQPIESHGIIQKLAAETGLAGLLAMAWLAWVLSKEVRRGWRVAKRRPANLEVYALLVVALIGAGIYQLFDTTYWTPRLWLPVGLVLAASRVLREEPSKDPDFLTPSHG